eukprot:Protomagalhaensia_wolfi_Nauph_80__3836@NODE_3887_length_685_cov_1451_595975_g3071_i0_p1_GENE_NODE_3887_length_685_cov_1451_595975_g3071_i0NODE_3887_length_685_cov_1451_595975_g3071_i0_p1_ORF_typecomplete_len114_score1_63_NODE_3887_length_685_cov_1451_595975_g3071_i080421
MPHAQVSRNLFTKSTECRNSKVHHRPHPNFGRDAQACHFLNVVGAFCATLHQHLRITRSAQVKTSTTMPQCQSPGLVKGKLKYILTLPWDILDTSSRYACIIDPELNTSLTHY